MEHKKVNVQVLVPQPTDGIRTIDTTSNKTTDSQPAMRSSPIEKVLRLEEPFNLEEILKGLVEAADILLHKKDYDGHGWEHLEYCFRYAKDVIEVLQSDGEKININYPVHHPIKFGRWLLKYAKEAWDEGFLCWEHEGRFYDTNELYEKFCRMQ